MLLIQRDASTLCLTLPASAALLLLHYYKDASLYVHLIFSILGGVVFSNDSKSLDPTIYCTHYKAYLYTAGSFVGAILFCHNWITSCITSLVRNLVIAIVVTLHFNSVPRGFYISIGASTAFLILSTIIIDGIHRNSFKLCKDLKVLEER